ncbi:uncharacterized protein LOC121875697 [Homarus americanus]|uniref:uncharacterized protein LOC121875697 n=1 Tax=Homarus americanus TaxID=6706 RepID=UPI001C49716E|nr:uncharacterized protein LOC121875697 [Homarus americanus]
MQMCQLAVAVMVVVMATVSLAGPLADKSESHVETPSGITILKNFKPAGGLPTTLQQRSSLKVPKDSTLVGEISLTPRPSTPENAPINSQLVGPISSQQQATNIKVPANSHQVTNVPRMKIETCSIEGVFGIPNDCQHFYMCKKNELPTDSVPYYNTYLYRCDTGLNYMASEYECLKYDCYPPQYELQMSDPGMPAMPPVSSQGSPWMDTLPKWFNDTPWWFKTPPAWFHTPPAWFNIPPKPQVIDEEIQIETGEGIVPGSITKEITLGTNASISGQENTFYADSKTLRIHIPIKIIQQ